MINLFKKQFRRIVRLFANWHWPKSSWNSLRKAAPVLLRAIPVTVLLTIILNSVIVFKQVERPVQEVLVRVLPSPNDSEVAIVRITHDDYQNMFGGKSPLNPAVLKDLINALARAGPKAIGVDIDTANPVFETLEPQAGWPPIVWAREGKYSNRYSKQYLATMLGEGNRQIMTGLVSLMVDEDGVVRRYSRLSQTHDGPFPTFAWKILEQCPSVETAALKASVDPMFIKYLGDPKQPYRIDLSASEVLSLAADPNWPNQNILKQKIVLLGGDYAAQDEHLTPLGWMVGVEIIAQILETELAGGGVKTAGKITTTLVMIAAGIALWFLYYYFNLGVALLLTTVAIPLLSLSASLIAYNSLSQAVYFIPVLIAVLVVQLYEHYKTVAEKRETAMQDAAKNMKL